MKAQAQIIDIATRRPHRTSSKRPIHIEYYMGKQIYKKSAAVNVPNAITAAVRTLTHSPRLNATVLVYSAVGLPYVEIKTDRHNKRNRYHMTIRKL